MNYLMLVVVFTFRMKFLIIQAMGVFGHLALILEMFLWMNMF